MLYLLSFAKLMAENIHTTFDQILSRDQKEALLEQKGIAVWLTGFSGSGKTTIAANVEKKLYEKGFLTQVLDGDNIRSGINNNLGFSEDDREENIRRIAEVVKLFVNCGIITLASFVSPTIKIREKAKKIIGDDFNEVYIATSIEECENRDVKGLYEKARKGEIKNFTGIDSPYERPLHPDLIIETENKTVEESSQVLFDYIVNKLNLK